MAKDPVCGMNVAGLFAGPKKAGKFSGTLSEGTVTGCIFVDAPHYS